MSNLLKTQSIEAEYNVIVKTLQENGFNKTKAAIVLKIDRKTLYNKLKKYKELIEPLREQDVNELLSEV